MKKSALPMKATVSSEKRLFGEEDLVNLLRLHFGYSHFRGKQLEAIEAVLSGRDCFCLMPTGGGKSMCYQIPALVKPGIVLVISPLIALMENQVASLKEKGINAEYLSSTQTFCVKEKIYGDLDSGKPSLRLLYVTPELVATAGFMSKMTKLYNRGLLNLIAVDEAHCVSTWGHDFRPGYRKLSSLRKNLPDVAILALTATAVPKVQKDVIESLCLQHPLILRTSFNRPNIFYEVRYKDLLDDAYADLSNLLKSSGGVCSIIYCLERTTCDDLSAHLSRAGISCASYHAGLNNKVRSSVLDDWISSKIQVVIATVAFGPSEYSICCYHTMLLLRGDVRGIDRKDVRIVCHFNIPKSMEAFYQESGRAGRDQLPSRSVMYYGLDDRKRMEFIVSNVRSKKCHSIGPQDSLSKDSLANFNQMTEYCEGSGCRRKKILESFGEQVPASLCGKTCDVCKHPNLVAKQLEELAQVPSKYQKNGLSPIFISSLPYMATEETEFWNRADEASFSDEDISDSDDGSEVLNSMNLLKFSSKSGLDERLEYLERAEEAYCQEKDPKKQAGSSVDKKAVSEALREAAKQRLLNSLKQAQQRLGNLMIEINESAASLENECYKIYGKVGKTFYNSQVASTIRWLSSSSSLEIINRLHSSSPKSSSAGSANLNSVTSLPKIPDRDQQPPEPNGDKNQDSALPEPSSKSVWMEIPSQAIALPPILSFSEFVSKKGKESQSNISSARCKHSLARNNMEPKKHARNDAEKRKNDQKISRFTAGLY